MKISEQWLREWIDPPVDGPALAEQLTLLGLEVDEWEPAAPAMHDIVVATVEQVAPHPDADRLRVCEVNDGTGTPLQIVCGAPNVRAGMHTVLARVGGQLPDGTRLKKAKLRGVVSMGMLCSAAELGISDEHDGIMDLTGDLTPGQSVIDALTLDDSIMTVELTPDRGDCLSVQGLARDLSAKYDLPVTSPAGADIAAVHEQQHGVEVEPGNACVRYSGRVLTGVDVTAASPLWISERLRRSGIRTINPAVDVTNYVMLECGQPMHAFDLDKLQGAIRVRLAAPDESLTLLDGRTVSLTPETTVIADDSGAIGIAGIMGGQSTAVDAGTRNIFFESALFLPEQINGKPRHYAAPSESSHRFERGVDPGGQLTALQRATALMIDIAGGEAGPVADWQDADRLPLGASLVLRRARLHRLLGVELDESLVTRILTRLGIVVHVHDDGWHVTPPSHRYDLRIEEDYIEEIGRVNGYDSLPRTSPAQQPSFAAAPETEVPLAEVRQHLVNRGYQEVVTYSFVDTALQSQLRPDLPALPLANPISSELAVMRTSLIPGLINTLQGNLSRQSSAMRLFETGLRFLPASAQNDGLIDVRLGDDVQLDDSLTQQNMLAGLIVGERAPAHWSGSVEVFDFFDIKADLEALFHRANRQAPGFEPATVDLLHPGQSAHLVIEGQRVGYLGRLHPGIVAALDIDVSPLVFECALSALQGARVPAASPVSRYPRVRRDIALLMAEGVSHETLLKCVRSHAPEWLVDVITFDLYRGERIDKSSKSIALGLIMQHLSRTLADDEIEDAVTRIVAGVESDVGAVLRN